MLENLVIGLIYITECAIVQEGVNVKTPLSKIILESDSQLIINYDSQATLSKILAILFSLFLIYSITIMMEWT